MKGKISKKNIAVIIVALLIISIVSGICIKNSLSKRARDEKNIYMALCYLKQKDYENAEEYLEWVRKETTKELGFVRDSAEIIRQYLLGNQVLLEIELDVLQMDHKMNDDQKSITGYLIKMSEQNCEAEDYEKVIKRLIRMLDISEKNLELYELEYEIENNAFYSGGMTQAEYKEYKELCGEETAKNLQLSVDLSAGNYEAVFEEAVERVKENPSEENRLLLADIIARSAYSSYDIKEEDLYDILGQKYDSDKREKAEEEYEDTIEELQDKIEDISFKMQVETDGERVTKLNEQLKELYAEVEEVENRFQKGLVYKALNSIAAIHSLEAEVMKAKLYYALNQEEKASEILLDSVDSIEFVMSDNTVVKKGLEVFSNLAKGTIYSEEAMKTEVADALEKMLNYVNEDIRIRNMNAYEGNLVTDLSNELLAKYKYMNNDIYITSFDVSEYPSITLTLNAREEILEDIVNKKGIVLRDTHYDVKYDAHFVENILSTICFVVDTSGSMDGVPIDNAKEALVAFSKQMDADMNIALVEFNNGARIVTELSGNISSFIQASETLYASGGTDITEGIRCGIEALQESSGMKNIILMTDGQSSLDTSVIEEAERENVTIYTVGFGNVDSDMLELIAEETGGNFTMADSSGDLLSVYESIGMMIGNSVNLTYTVSENPEEMQRYVYIVSEEYETAKKHNYTNAEGTESKVFAFDSGYVFQVEDMEERKKNNEEIKMYIPVDGAYVEKVEVNGQTLETIEEYGRVYIEMPPITKEGLYDLTFIFSDGSRDTVEECILVYKEELQEEIRQVYRVRIGCLIISSDRFYLMSDGTIVLCGAHLSENSTIGDTLSAATNNLVILDNCTVSTEYYNDTRNYDWGDAGNFHLDGVIYLERADAQNQSVTRSISSMGQLSGEINSQQCTIKAR